MKPKSLSSKKSVPPPLAGGGRGRGRARASEHAVEGQRAALEIREGTVAPYLPHRHFRESGNPVALGRMTLGNALPIKYGKSKSESHGEPCEDVAVYGSSGKIGTFNRRLTAGPTLIVGRKGSAGAIHYSPEPCWPIDTVYYTEQLPGRYLPYFRYLLESLRLGQYDRSTAIPSLSRDDYDAIEVNVPREDQQRRIVAELETQLTRLDASVTALKRVQANLKRYRASVLKAACEGRLVPTKAAGQWTHATLGEVARVVGGLTKNPKRTKLEKQLPYLRVANVYANELRLDDIEHIGVADSELEKLLVKAGDLLIVEGNGSKDQIGRLAIWDGSIEPCVHQNHLIKVRVTGSAIPKWILIWLLSPQGRKHIERVSSSTSGLYTLSVGKVSALPVVLPPLDEQKGIVAEVERRLSVIEELEATVAANLQRAERLRQSVLAQKFQSPREVNHEPD